MFINKYERNQKRCLGVGSLLFKDRVDAGRRLAERLAGEALPDALVLGIPRGGVVVAAEVARALDLPLDIIVPRKIGAPANPELAVGAVAQDGTVIYNTALLRRLHLDEADLAEQVQAEIREIERRMALYRGSRVPPKLGGRTVILVDDGVATGYTVLAALRSLRRAGAKKIILAVPVAPPETLARLKPEVDHIVCLASPHDFWAVGQFYQDFRQNSNQDVIALLRPGADA
jgi:predicted phosphoribosyltransferase